MSYYVDGTAQASNVSNASAINSFGIGATNLSYTTEGAYSWVCEIIVYNSALSTTDRQSVENYIKSKWGTP